MAPRCPAAPSSPRWRPPPRWRWSAAEAAAPLPPAAAAPTTVRFALDWTPNTNHTGLYVAQQQGWFTDAGLDVQILPYNSTSPDTLVSSGAADFGISFQDSFTVSKAAGADILSVLAVLQHWGTAIGMRADRADLTIAARPRRQDLRRVRRRLRGAEDAGDHPRGGREGRLQDGRARHVGLRGAVRGAGRLHRALPGVGGHRGAAAERAAQDVRLRRLRLPRRLQRDRHRQPGVDEGAPGRRGGVRGGACSAATSSARTTRHKPPSC